jgi:hypothetical protein
MAKFTRFDPRNKKQDRNKKRSLNRDLRLREEGKSKKNPKSLLELQAEENYETEELEPSYQ